MAASPRERNADRFDERIKADRLDSPHRPWKHAQHAMAPLHSIPRVVRAASLVAACMLAHAAAAAPAGMAGPPTCRELERRLELTKPEAIPTELNLVLFSAADSGCVPLARRLLDAGASLDGARPARRHGAGAGGAGGTRGAGRAVPRPGRADRRAQSRRRDRALRRDRERATGDASRSCWPTAPIRTCRAARASRRLRRRRSRATVASSINSSPVAPIRTSWTRPARRRSTYAAARGFALDRAPAARRPASTPSAPTATI